SARPSNRPCRNTATTRPRPPPPWASPSAPCATSSRSSGSTDAHLTPTLSRQRERGQCIFTLPPLGGARSRRVGRCREAPDAGAPTALLPHAVPTSAGATRTHGFSREALQVAPRHHPDHSARKPLHRNSPAARTSSTAAKTSP